MSDQPEEQMAKLFFACNLPFDITDHLVFEEIIQMLWLGYTPLNHKDIGGYLLDQIHYKITTQVWSLKPYFNSFNLKTPMFEVTWNLIVLS